MKKQIYHNIFILIIVLPLYFFIKDFFHLDEFYQIDYIESLRLIKISLIQSGLSVFFSILIALIPAYYMSLKKDRLTKALDGLIFIPFFFPAVSTVIALTIIFKLPFIEKINFLYSLKGIVVANTFYNSPIILKYLKEGLIKIPKNIVEASRIDGAKDIEIFFKIKMPLILSHLFRGAFLVFIYSFLSFGIVLAIGGIKYYNLEVEIANSITKDGDFTKALFLGGLQFVIMIFFNYIGEKIPTYMLLEENEEKSVGIFIKIYSLIYLLFEYLVVFLGVLYGFYNYYTNEFTFKYFIKLFNKNFNYQYPVIEGIKNSFILAGITPFIVIFFTYVLLKNHNRKIERTIFAIMGISSAFLGIVLLYLNILYEIPLKFLIFYGYFLISIPISYSFMYNHIVYFPQEIDDLAKIDGVNGIKRFIKVEYPILKNIFLATYLQIFAIILGEFTISYTMQLGKEFPTVALVNYSLYSSKKFLEASALSSVTIFTIIILFYLSNRIKNRK